MADEVSGTFYYANPTGDPTVHDAMAEGILGFIDTPRQKNHRPGYVWWCADNGCFGKGFDERHWAAWLIDNAEEANRCAFATAPDVVGDAAATLERSRPWLPRIRKFGYRPAFVAQDGQQDVPLPWDDFDVLFIGGTDAFKFSPISLDLVQEGKRRGKRIHFGRINSLRRYRAAEAYGADSADGTILKHGPSVNLIRVLGWYRDLDERPAMFKIGAGA